jgi:hypothetical protein
MFFGTHQDQKIANRTGKAPLDASRRAACAFNPCLAQYSSQRFDFFFFAFFVFFGIIFFTAFLAFLAADFTAPGSSIAETFFIAKKQICYAIGFAACALPLLSGGRRARSLALPVLPVCS